MRTLPNWKVQKTCPKCGNRTYGQYDKYCPRCGTELPDKDEWLASITDYAKSLLIELFEDHPDIATTTSLREIPAAATEYININGTILCDTWETRMVLAQNWNELEIALDDWKDVGFNFEWKGIEALHVFAVTQHAKMVWREIMPDDVERLTEDDLEYLVTRIKEL
jgi:predicted nucleic-acid-binding Zn-ribbon protein